VDVLLLCTIRPTVFRGITALFPLVQGGLPDDIPLLVFAWTRYWGAGHDAAVWLFSLEYLFLLFITLVRLTEMTLYTS
jgi:hypothetical protein